MSQPIPGPRADQPRPDRQRPDQQQPRTVEGQVVPRGDAPPPFPLPPGYTVAPPGQPYPPQAYYETPAQPPNAITRLAVLVVTLIAAIYLANPGAGLIELIPDVIPVLGNLDEATALALLFSGLNFFGLNLQWLMTIFGPGLSKRRNGPR
ncbi:MAG: DUF1232 domain-containing protein [Anaerolineae bacterium]|nr:DUF1232 domain-containing protein [Anaerolineae bacterium]